MVLHLMTVPVRSFSNPTLNHLCGRFSGCEAEAMEAFFTLFGNDITCLVGPTAHQPSVMQRADRLVVCVEEVEVGEVGITAEAVLLWCASFSVFAQPCPRDARKAVLVFVQKFVCGVSEGVVPALCWRVAVWGL